MKKWIVCMAALLLLTGCTTGQTQPEEEAQQPEEEIVAEADTEQEAEDTTATQPQLSYTKETLNIENEEKSIAGVLYRPITEEKRPLVILCHGYKSTYMSLQYMATQVADRGCLTYVFDFCGGAPGSRSSGTMEEMSVMTEREDLNLVIDTLTQELADVYDGRVFLCGWSQGGYVVTATATARPEDIAGVLLLAPAFHIDDFVHSSFESFEEIPETITEELGYHYFADIWDYDIFEQMPQYTGPVVIYHGDADSAVDYTYSERAVEAFPNATLTVMPGTTHMFVNAEFDTFADAVAELVAQ